MMRCLEFQEYFSHDFCPLVLGTLLVLEVIEMGLAFFSPCSAVSDVLCRPQAAFAGCRRVVTGAVFLLHNSPVRLDPEAAPAELGWEQHIEHRGADAAQLRAQESVPLRWGAVSFCVWLPGVTAGSGAWCCRSAACSLSVAGANCDGEAIVQLSRAGVRCRHNVAGNGVSSPAVSGGIFCAIQSQVWLLMSSPSALSWYMLFCVFPAVLLQALGPEPSSRTLSPTRDTLAMEPARGISQHPADGKGGVQAVLPRRALWSLRCDCPSVVPHCGLGCRGQDGHVILPCPVSCESHKQLPTSHTRLLRSW